jgi:hypothetical protein
MERRRSRNVLLNLLQGATFRAALRRRASDPCRAIPARPGSPPIGARFFDIAAPVLPEIAAIRSQPNDLCKGT